MKAGRRRLVFAPEKPASANRSDVVGGEAESRPGQTPVFFSKEVKGTTGASERLGVSEDNFDQLSCVVLGPRKVCHRDVATHW